ncbi:MAG: hypothetical protein N2746_09955 [Deltaproteobacteria bacterium]|nr:hypothetical protein [Deltaproteobacteria bacterium]
MRDRIKEVKSGSLIYTDVGKDMIIEGVGEGGYDNRNEKLYKSLFETIKNLETYFTIAKGYYQLGSLYLRD